MPYLKTSSTEWRNLMTAIKDFAVTTNGWTLDYDDISDGGSGLEGQCGISKGNCKLTFGQRLSTPNDDAFYTKTQGVSGGTVQDAALFFAVNHSITGSLHQFWGHPNGTTNNNIITGDTDADAVELNDVAGPMSEVHMFSDSSGGHINVVIKSSEFRWTHLSFGVLDDIGMTTPNVGYVCATDWEWWEDGASPSSLDCNRPASAQHKIGHFMGPGDNMLLFIPDLVVDPALDFTDDDFQTSETRIIHDITATPSDALSGADYMIQHFLFLDNPTTSGGTSLHALPVMHNSTLGSLFHTHLGILPKVRLVSMAGHAAGDEITLSGDTWIVFPLKQIGNQENTATEAFPTKEPNSIEYGFAYLKEV